MNLSFCLLFIDICVCVGRGAKCHLLKDDTEKNLSQPSHKNIDIYLLYMRHVPGLQLVLKTVIPSHGL